MKHSLRYCFVLLALATTGLFAEAATEPTPTQATGQHKSVKIAKLSKKGKKAKKTAHKKHAKKHKKKAAH